MTYATTAPGERRSSDMLEREVHIAMREGDNVRPT